MSVRKLHIEKKSRNVLAKVCALACVSSQFPLLSAQWRLIHCLCLTSVSTFKVKGHKVTNDIHYGHWVTNTLKYSYKVAVKFRQSEIFQVLL